MPKLNASEVSTGKHLRYFVQPGGAHPDNDVLYSGLDATYLTIESADNPKRGGQTPINVHDPRRVGQYRRVGRSIDAPDFPTATVQFMQKLDVLPRHLTTLPDCVATFYGVVGDCKDLSDFLYGWSSYTKIYSTGEVDDTTEAGSAFDADEGLMDELSYTFAAIYLIGKFGFGEKAAVEVYSEIKDIVYGSRVQCGTCGPSDDGTKLIYAVMDNTVASPGTGPSVASTIDGGVTWTVTAITGAVAGDSPQAIDVVGQYLIVVYDNAGTGGYFYSQLNSITGAPSTTWTKVTTGFTAGSAPRDVYVESANAIWFCGRNGRIYKSTSITAGVSVKDAGDTTTVQLNRIHGQDEIIVAVGEAGRVIYSTNRGATFANTTVFPSSVGNDALAVVDDYLWWVGDDAGNVYYSVNQGATWTDANWPSDQTAVQDIVFINSEVGYIASTTSGPVATLYASWNGGKSWSASAAPRVQNWPVLDRVNRIAFPFVPNQNVAANNLALGGLAGNGTDGIILLGTVAVL